MPKNDSELTLAVVGRTSEGDLGIVTMHFSLVDSQMSGAWDFKDSEVDEWRNVLEDKCLFFMDSAIEKVIANKFSYEIFNLTSFIESAIEQTEESIKVFKDYVSENHKVRSKLVFPEFFNWKKINSLSSPKEIERQLGTRFLKLKPLNDMSEIMGTARILKHLMDSWRKDELERISRSAIFPELKQKIRPSGKLVR